MIPVLAEYAIKILMASLLDTGAYCVSELKVTPAYFESHFLTRRALHLYIIPHLCSSSIRKVYQCFLMGGASLRSTYVQVFMSIRAFNYPSMASVHYWYLYASLKFSGTKRSCTILNSVGNIGFSEILDALKRNVCFGVVEAVIFVRVGLNRSLTRYSV